MPTATRLRDHITGGVVTIVALILVAILTGAWSAKESTSAHTADVQAIRSDVQRLKDVICLDHPNAPQCKP